VDIEQHRISAVGAANRQPLIDRSIPPIRIFSSRSTPWGATILRAFAMMAVASERLAGLAGSCARTGRV
jgi:hypothetical protein